MRKKIIASTVIGVGIVAGMALKPSGHVGPSYLYPNPQLTQGNASTLDAITITASFSDNCPSGKKTCTYSQDHRNVPQAEHQKVYDEYKVPVDKQNISNGEIDHFYPMCAGASNDISNLWYQPITNMWNGVDYGFKTKDKLETWVCSQIKAGKIDPKVAYQAITTDWVKYFMENEVSINNLPITFGSSQQDYDGDN